MAAETRRRSIASAPARPSTSTASRASWRCGSRCARCSGSTPIGRAPAGINAAHEFEEALGFWARDYLHQILRGPGLAVAADGARARRRLDALIFAEIDRRRASARARRGHPQPAARRHRRGRRDALQAPHPRRGHDAAVRRPRHDDLDGRLPLPRAGPQPGARSTTRRSTSGWPSTRRCACTRRRGSGRGARSSRSRFGGMAAARRRAGQLLLVGQPPPARRVARARRLPPRALRPGQPRADPQGRLRPVRRRLAHVHRDALRPGRDRRHRRARSSSASASSSRPAIGCETRQMPTIGPKHGMPMVPRAAKGGPVVAEPALAA